jgi:hypothetical protein
MGSLSASLRPNCTFGNTRLVRLGTRKVMSNSVWNRFLSSTFAANFVSDQPHVESLLRRTLSRISGMEDEEEIPYISGSGEGLMEDGSAVHSSARRNEDIALDLMKFVAMTTGYGRTTSSGVGFQGTGSAAKPEEYAAHLLELYGKCRAAVEGKK